MDLWVKASVGEEKGVRGEGGALVTKEGYIEVVGCVTKSTHEGMGGLAGRD